MNDLERTYLTVPLGNEPHRLAQQFAAEQTTPEKGSQIYLNTLAVYAVHSYLKWLQIETDLSQGDSWHPGLRTLFDVADLPLPSIGRLECRPVASGATNLPLPPEVTENRIGYVAVQFNEPLNQAQLLGFWAVEPAAALDVIPLDKLRPLDTLLDLISTVTDTVADENLGLLSSQKRVNLSDWLDNVFETGWQSLEDLFSSGTVGWALARSSKELRETGTDSQSLGLTRGRLIDLGVLLSGHQVALIITLLQTAAEEMDIRAEVRPAGGQLCLPPELQLIVLDHSGICLQTQARNADNRIQLEFSGEVGEQFSIKLVLGNVDLTEDFVI
ncbi:DUF1822 family protein [Leptolyngbya sp. FACHB-261]|uniref:DUF1822 family protein n=1 Tax=Leptolyngbya sp. FACHB-261 TaxID=2692806 RepID=UPI001682D8C8|nr:DUF1822 family protein [Leptolyngbya sp. FACHB-261]MBD2103986.1 DUF1822 family protein [Leptolyngbya sp. FACHB-261]